jgi:hypothetical protein
MKEKLWMAAELLIYPLSFILLPLAVESLEDRLRCISKREGDYYGTACTSE